MDINTEMVENIAHLARLEFSGEEKEAIRVDMQRMIAFVEKLAEIDTGNVEPLVHMSNAVNVFREDEVQGSISREDALVNAPVTDGVFFKVPKVIRR